MKLTVCCFIVQFTVLLCESKADSELDERLKKINTALLKLKNNKNRKIYNMITKSDSEVDKPVGDSILRVNKKGGKITVKRDNRIITMRIKKIAEKREDDTEVADTPLEVAQFNITKNRDSSHYGIEAANIDIKARLSNNANISLQMFMFKETGNVTGEDGIVYELVKGGTKMNLNVEWPTEAAKIDIVLGIKCVDFIAKIKSKVLKQTRGMKRNGDTSRRGPKSMAVCPGARMTFSPKFRQNDNNTFSEMDDKYPLAEEPMGSENLIRLRFRGRSIFYDPIMDVGEDVEAEMGIELEDYYADSSAQSSKYATNTLIFFFALALFFNLFKTT